MAGHNLNAKVGSVSPKTDGAKFKSHLITILEKSTAVPFTKHRSEYKCFYCNSMFHLPSRLREHTAQNHKYMDFDAILRIWSEFNSSSDLMLDIQDLSCRACDTKISDISDLKIHFSENHDESLPNDILSNIVCFKLFDDVVRCFICKKDFQFFGSLKQHMKSHLPLFCQICGENFSTETDFADHEKTYCKPCGLCVMRFPSSKHRDAHIRLVHCKGFQCDLCSQQFTLRVALARHIRNIHYREKNETCDVCGKAFFDSRDLKMHKVSHSKNKPFECDICKKKYTRNAALQLHKRIHNNDRRYVCKVCGKSFIQWVTLNTHKLVHSDERKFKCPVCDRAYKDKQTMKKHCKKVHEKEDI